MGGEKKEDKKAEKEKRRENNEKKKLKRRRDKKKSKRVINRMTGKWNEKVIVNKISLIKISFPRQRLSHEKKNKMSFSIERAYEKQVNCIILALHFSNFI